MVSMTQTDQVRVVPKQLKVSSVRNDVIKVGPHDAMTFRLALWAQRIIRSLLLPIGSPSLGPVELANIDVRTPSVHLTPMCLAAQVR